MLITKSIINALRNIQWIYKHHLLNKGTDTFTPNSDLFKGVQRKVLTSAESELES